MSKRDLKNINELTKEQLEEQILIMKNSVLSKYYNFVFNPQEEKLLQAMQAQ
jgi:hypothetical protein